MVFSFQFAVSDMQSAVCAVLDMQLEVSDMWFSFSSCSVQIGRLTGSERNLVALCAFSQVIHWGGERGAEG